MKGVSASRVTKLAREELLCKTESAKVRPNVSSAADPKLRESSNVRNSSRDAFLLYLVRKFL